MQNEIGISPVLLQAISHTLTSSGDFDNIRSTIESNEESKVSTKLSEDKPRVMIIESDHSETKNEHEVPLPAHEVSLSYDQDEQIVTLVSLERCPICYDKVSGYHYGINSCESCKGFFKRTVQNGRSYSCHRSNDCQMELNSRKKCAACRFKKCLSMGMKIEAIRLDRSRGGRSSYEGAQRSTPNKKTKSNIQLNKLSEGAEHRKLLEQLLQNDDTLNQSDENNECCENMLEPNDMDPLSSLMHIVDHCLYGVVRWARSLPNFSNISTEDQVLLLQNSWLDLLLFNAAFKNIKNHTNNFIVGHEKILSSKHAIELGVQTLTQRMIDLRDRLEILHIDKLELCAIKTLVLLSSDITISSKKLNNTSAVNDYRLKVSVALQHHCRHQSKYLQVLVRMSDVARLSTDVKQVLINHFNRGSVSNTLLLHELLKEEESIISNDENLKSKTNFLV